MSQFSTNEQISLEKRIDVQQIKQKTNLDKISDVYEINRCVKFIQDNNYNTVCLQFPDYLLPDSVEVVQQLEQQLKRKVYVLGDTAYESCCLDFTAAKHISADCLIHFGAVCFSRPENIIPYLNIYEKYELNVDQLSSKIKEKFENVTVICDTPYLHKLDKLKEIGATVKPIDEINDISDISGAVLFLGQNNRKLLNIYLKYKIDDLYYYDAEKCEILDYSKDLRVLKRRYFLAEKIRDAQTIGIVLSTLAVANYLHILNRTIELIKLSGRKYYILSVGKPNPAKLANFPEIDVFVVIGCSMNEIYENREYYKSIVTVSDLEMGLNSSPQNCLFTYDFNDVLSNELKYTEKETDISLLSGKLRNLKQDVSDTSDNTDDKLIPRNDGKIALNDHYGAGYLAGKTWTGLEQDLGQTEVKLATEGRRGIPLNYDNEL